MISPRPASDAPLRTEARNETKADLVGDCFERSFEVIGQAKRAGTAAGGDGWTRLTGAANAMVRYQLSDHGPLLRYTALAAVPESLLP